VRANLAFSDLSAKADECINLSAPFFVENLITYIGNKRALLGFLNRGIEKVKKSLNKSKLVCLDGFAGSGAVSRLMKYHSVDLTSNDLELYSYIVNKCYLANKSSLDLPRIERIINGLNNRLNGGLEEGFIAKNYAPADDGDIRPGERVFYTRRNAMALDTLKTFIYKNIDGAERHFYLAPLLVAASVHNNTSGVFKGFHKKDGIGHFGGRGENALARILRPITLRMPIFGDCECGVNVLQKNVNDLVKESKEYDLAYYDPPYNQHPYGSNYFMLNILAAPEKEIPIQNGVSGIAKNWNRSDYNKRGPAVEAMDDLIKNTKSKYILISYNNEGIIPFDTFRRILEKYGAAEIMTMDYNTYRGCRNLRGRSKKVKELLWILKRSRI
jgi:adenine-specific DNA-methyltransferase